MESLKEEFKSETIKILGKRLKDGVCSFCGKPISNGDFCECPDAQKVNRYYKKANRILNEYNNLIIIQLLKKVVRAGFEKRVKPTLFLSNLFKTVEVDTIEVELQARSVKSIYAIDTQLGTGGRRVDLSGYDKKTFTIPEYNNFGVLTEKDVFKAQFGENEYQIRANIAKTINDTQEIIDEMQTRAIEKQAADALFNGKIKLADNSEIEFNKKATHTISKASAKWSASSGRPITDIKNACKLCIADGKISVSEFNLIMDSASLTAFLSNSEVKENGNFIGGIKRTDINMPVEMTPGAMFHGQISCGSYRVNIWTYEATYDIPVGYNFAGEGSSVGYIPYGCAVLLPMNPEFEKYYAAINDVNAKSLLGGAKLQLVKTQKLPYCYDEVVDGSVVTKAGVKTRPLCVPKNIDSFVTFKDLV